VTGRSSITVDLIVDATAEQTWAAVTDWPRQSEWVAATTVRNTAHDGVGVGGALEAVTGWGPLAVVDPMVIVEWDPPRRVVVEHQGKVVRGLGIFEVLELPGDRSRFVWSEELELPLGLVGRSVWPLLRPLFVVGIRRSLRRFRRSVVPDDVSEAG
jgi:hypothetical protein